MSNMGTRKETRCEDGCGPLFGVYKTKYEKYPSLQACRVCGFMKRKGEEE